MAYVFGTGVFAQKIRVGLMQSGLIIHGHLELQNRDSSIEYVLAESETASRQETVYIGINNPDADIRKIVAALHRLGYDEVRSPVETVQFIFHSTGVDYGGYWLTGRSDLIPSQGRLSAVENYLEDETSRSLLRDIMQYRSNGSVGKLPLPLGVERQYFDEDITKHCDLSYFVDAGAYNGDTFRRWSETWLNTERSSYVAFEPDLNNFLGLEKTVVQYPCQSMLLPLALGDKTDSVKFSSESAASSSISEFGSSVITQVRGDAIFSQLPIGSGPTFMKFDIEGAELEAIQGLIATLKTHKPNLAISVYHRPEHIVSIQEFLLDLSLGYSFKLRNYAHSTFDTILYALQSER